MPEHVGELETKVVFGQVCEAKQQTVNGVPVGVVRGHLATWEPDTGGVYGVPDVFHPGAFLESLQEHRDRGNRQIRMTLMHKSVIGGFPIETAREDEKGLFVEGHVNLETRLGADTFSLVRQGVFEDLSVAYWPLSDRIDADLRHLFRVRIKEGAVADEPANQGAQIMEWKTVVPFQDLPLAPRDRAWDSGAAVGRVRSFTGSEEAPSSRYRRAFLWYDSSAPDEFGSYKLPIADVVGESLVAVPRAIAAAAAALHGGRGGLNVPPGDRPGLIRHLERYYSKMDEPSPFESEERMFVGFAEAKSFSPVEFEQALRRGATFSKAAARLLAEGLTEARGVECYDNEGMADVLAELREAKRLL